MMPAQLRARIWCTVVPHVEPVQAPPLAQKVCGVHALQFQGASRAKCRQATTIYGDKYFNPHSSRLSL